MNLIDAFDKPPNGYMYWCADCLTEHVLKPGYGFICHECGEPFREELGVEEHWHDKHAPVYPKDLKK